MSVSPALQALTISIRNGGVAKCELLAHWDFDTYSGLPGDSPIIDESITMGLEIIGSRESKEESAMGIEIIPTADKNGQQATMGIQVINATST